MSEDKECSNVDDDLINDDIEDEEPTFYHYVDHEISLVDNPNIAEYLSNPYSPPTLDIQTQQKVDEKFNLLRRKGFIPMVT